MMKTLSAPWRATRDSAAGRRAAWPQRGRLLALTSLLASVLTLSVGCGPEDTLTAYDVVLTPESDCRQVGQGAVQCEDEAEIGQVSTQGRWVFDERDATSFLLNNHEGRVLAGIHFQNDGSVANTNACTGDGGTCYFARTEAVSYDVETACQLYEQHIVDTVIDDEGGLSGVVILVTFTDEACVNSLITEKRLSVSAQLAEDVVLARETFE